MLPPDTHITYITRDIERAIGIPPSSQYRIITNRNSFSEAVKNQYPDFVTLIDSHDNRPLSTAALLERAAADSILPTGSHIVVFKTTSQIESLAEDRGWKLFNPVAVLAERVENKITQVEWLGDLARKYLPPHSIELIKNIRWTGEPFILQWAHGHTGEGTLLINRESDLLATQRDFPNREARKTVPIKGPSFTVNAVVAKNTILMGNISYQITGLGPFTDSHFATIGNDWSLTHTLLSTSEIRYIETMVHELGLKLANSGWRGLFGVDLMRDDERNTIHLIEINARQPASSSFESFLQNENRLQGLKGITIFEAHIAALLEQQITEPFVPINDGAQIVQRVTTKCLGVSEDIRGALELQGYQVITYPNTDFNADLMRIQSPHGIMQDHNKWNERGKEIIQTLIT